MIVNRLMDRICPMDFSYNRSKKFRIMTAKIKCLGVVSNKLKGLEPPTNFPKIYDENAMEHSGNAWCTVKD